MAITVVMVIGAIMAVNTITAMISNKAILVMTSTAITGIKVLTTIMTNF